MHQVMEQDMELRNIQSIEERKYQVPTHKKCVSVSVSVSFLGHIYIYIYIYMRVHTHAHNTHKHTTYVHTHAHRWRSCGSKQKWKSSRESRRRSSRSVSLCLWSLLPQYYLFYFYTTSLVTSMRQSVFASLFSMLGRFRH